MRKAALQNIGFVKFSVFIYNIQPESWTDVLFYEQQVDSI